MNVYMQNVPHGLSDKKLERELRNYTTSIGIHAFNLQIRKVRFNKQQRYATVTFPTEELGQRFLNRYGQPHGPRRNPQEQIQIHGQPITFRPDKNPSPRDSHVVNALILRHDTTLEKIAAREAATPLSPNSRKASDRRFSIEGLECGSWAAEPTRFETLEFIKQHAVPWVGTLKFRPRSVDIDLDGISPGGQPTKYTLSMDYYWMRNIITDSHRDVIFFLKYAPKIYRHATPLATPSPSDRNEKHRIPGIDVIHQALAGLAFVYRVRLVSPRDHGRVLRLSEKEGIPPIGSKPLTTREQTPTQFGLSFWKLVSQLQKTDIIPFAVAFQLHALASNGILPPDSVSLLIPRVTKLVGSLGEDAATDIMEAFTHEAGYGNNPINNPQVLSAEELEIFLEDHISRKHKDHTNEYMTNLRRRRDSLAFVRSVSITPTGVFSFGPVPEAQNRVLRKYSKFHDHFLRVNFIEEDGEMFQQGRNISNDEIYKLFRERLRPEMPIVIAGRTFQFLGFSSSSLKSQGCWFMANFTFEGQLMTPQRLIDELGDFGKIQTPGRYAARVGQAFSDTVNSIHVKLDEETEIPDIERLDANGVNRCFSDGIGKVSRAMVERIWEASDEINRDKPTVFQIRYTGAKGMICLDPKIPGDKIHLRPSMIKFRGSTDRNIEICSWGGRKLDMYLNRPMVKVLEDLGVKAVIFLKVQEDAVNLLRHSSESPALASNFMQRHNVSAQILKIHWVVVVLNNIGIVFWEDRFLEKCYELALLMALRSIKYKARIPIKGGLTLIGVLDESGYLAKGEIYASYIEDGKHRVVRGRVLITRSPMYHPCDIQMVQAIDVPELSPLRHLKNCVAFSSKGDRPLPSMLSGGDLDGDLYNIITDERFHFNNNSPPAEYPPVKPVDLGRPVELSDVADFFVNFMKNNLLGMIATRHLIIADQVREGVWHQKCIKLAEMASTAVDFPKTGVPIDRKEIPQPPSKKARPDFMATGPRVLISKDKVMNEQERDELDDDEDDDSNPPLWYRSEKALGELYRAINEDKFLGEIRFDIQGHVQRGRGVPLARLWDYMEIQTVDYPDWEQYVQLASEIRNQYESDLKQAMVACSETPWNSTLTEEEMFVGTLLGKRGTNKRNFNLTLNMRAEYDSIAVYTVKRIRGEDRAQTIQQAMACLHICLPQRENQMRSFAWVVASVLLTEVDAMQKENKRSGRGRERGRGRPWMEWPLVG